MVDLGGGEGMGFSGEVCLMELEHTLSSVSEVSSDKMYADGGEGVGVGGKG